MGTGEESTPAKTSKPPSSTQDIPTALSYPDWSSPMQAYYGAGATPPPYYPSTVASPTPQTYMWGGQPHLMPPYPYPAMYPPGGVYAHPTMTMTPNSVQTGTELEGKGSEGKDRASAIKSKGTSVSTAAVGGKATETVRATSGSGNDGASQSGDSGSEGTTDGSEENGNQQDLSASQKGSFNKMLAEGANAQNTQQPVPAKPVGSVPATNLNIGMELWPATAGGTKMESNPSGASAAIPPAMVGREGVMPEQWMQQDERELKRQKRKQSNRESARRSRLRKQAECEELQHRVEGLTNDNRTLRDELRKLSEDCEKLASENNSIKEELTRLCGPEAVANIGQNNQGEA